MIVQASIDENRHAKGGAAGDQTGRETNVSNWSYSNWEELFRFKSQYLELGEKIAANMVKLANSNLIGYDQYQRTTLCKLLKKYDWSVDKYIASGEVSETDCSAFTYAAICTVIPVARRLYDEKKECPRTIWFWNFCQTYLLADTNDPNSCYVERYDNPNLLKNNDMLVVGDMLNRRAGHIVMVCDVDGSMHASPLIANANTYVANNNASRGGASTGSNAQNTVINLSSAIKQENMILKSDDLRENEFEVLRNLLIKNAPNSGREIVKTNELYDSNVLKSGQESRRERV